jgi:hypothetical protein
MAPNIWKAKNELKMIWKTAFLAEFQIALGYFPVQTETQENISQHSRCPVRNSNQNPPESKLRQLTVRINLLSPKYEIYNGRFGNRIYLCLHVAMTHMPTVNCFLLSILARDVAIEPTTFCIRNLSADQNRQQRL